MTIRWKENAVISVALRCGRRAVAQMMEDPFLYFFKCFADAGEPFAVDLARTPTLFCCAVTRQFLRYSDAKKETHVRARTDLCRPERWIDTNDGWREKVVWPGTKHERRVLIMGEEPGGYLTADREDFVGEEIDLDDHETIDAHELTNIWTFPGLNERLYLCDVLGKNVDPLKDLSFDRPLPLEARTFVDIIGSVGDLETWGYTLSNKPTKKKTVRKKAAKRRAAKKKASKKAPRR